MESKFLVFLVSRLLTGRRIFIPLITKGVRLLWCTGQHEMQMYSVFRMCSSPCLPDCEFIKTTAWIPGWGRWSCHLLCFMVYFSLFLSSFICGWVTEAAHSPQSILHPRTALGPDIWFCWDAVKREFTPSLAHPCLWIHFSVHQGKVLALSIDLSWRWVLRSHLPH